MQALISNPTLSTMKAIIMDFLYMQRVGGKTTTNNLIENGYNNDVNSLGVKCKEMDVVS